MHTINKNAAHISRHPLIRRLASINLDRDHFVIFGSGPLLAHGIRSDIGDIDVVARGPAWERARQLGVPFTGPLNGAPMAHFWGGLIEISQGWISTQWDPDELIDNCDVFDGFRFAKLEYVLRYKLSLMRPKDTKDLMAIMSRLRKSERPPTAA